MNDNHLATKRRKPSDAATLSALLPGLGQIYCGHLRQGILWMGVTLGVLVLAIAILLIDSTRLSLALSLIALDMVISMCCVVQAWRLAKRVSDGYQLKDYNCWYVYAVLTLLGIGGSALCCAFVLHERVFQAFVIPTNSMAPTIQPGDRIVSRKLIYLDRDPEPGELVIFRNPERRRQHYIKRVIATAGDTIEWREDGKILVNDTLLDQTPTGTPGEVTERIGERTYVTKHSTTTKAPTFGSLVVPPHHCFVLGDHRSHSRDSRHFGPIAYAALTAQPVAKIWGSFGKLQ